MREREPSPARQSEPIDSALPSRRAFLARAGGLGGAALVVGGAPVLAGRSKGAAEAAESVPSGGRERHLAAYRVRQAAAQRLLNRRPAEHPNNGDETRYPSRFGSYSKCLPHDGLGHVDPAAYDSMLAALASGVPSDFEAIPLGGTVKLGNPQASYTFDLEGFDSHELALPPAPEFSSAWEASEMGELYWQALTRDVAFADYATDPLIAQAAADMSVFSDFRGPSRAAW